jgi:hypothetical protein
MIPPERRRMLLRIAGRRNPVQVEIADALVGSWTQGELLAFGFHRTRDGRWLSPPEWRTS